MCRRVADETTGNKDMHGSAGRLRVIGRACMLPACLSPPRLSRSWVRHAVRPSRAAMLVGHCLEAK